MKELFAAIILLSSFVGMSVIIVRKLPVLRELEVSPRKKGVVIRIQDGIKRAFALRARAFWGVNSFDVFLQKVLSKIKILALKIEQKCSYFLEKLRTKTREKEESERYWEKIKKLSLKKKR